jgi:hypothetical protein
MLLLTYDQIELILILIAGPVSSLIGCIPADAPEWVTDVLMLIVPLLQAWGVSLTIRPASRKFFFWYRNLWP